MSASAKQMPVLNRLAVVALAIAGLLFTLSLTLLSPQAFDTFDRKASDWVWRHAATTTTERRVIIVDIDEQSLAAQGAWPWPREQLAELSKRLRELGATQQIFDLLLADPRTGDNQLGGVLNGVQAVTAQVFALDQGEAVQQGQLLGALSGLSCQQPIPQARGYIGLSSDISQGNTLSAGHITPRIDPDGAVRRVPAVLCFGDRAYPALALAAYWQGAAEGAEAAAVRLRPGLGWQEPAWWLEHPALPAAVPLTSQADLIVPYALAPEALVSVSAAEVLGGKAPPELFAGAWVLVGSTALGLGDAVPTPHGGAVGGIGVHAQLLAGLLDETLPWVPQGRYMLWLISAALLCGVLVWASCRFGRLAALLLIPATGMALVLLLVQHILALQAMRWELGWTRPGLFVVLFGLVLASLELARSRIEKERLYAHLSSYLPAPVALALLGRDAGAEVLAERREVSVLFADIRNFSRFCETRPPEAAAGLLHEFIEVASRIVEAHGGLIEAVQGDAVMALWNGSRPCANHARQAALAARALLPAVEDILAAREADALAPLALGIGIETGPALIGSFGPVSRRLHTALGETVSVANAIQKMTGELAWPILCGPGAAAQLAAVDLRPQGNFLLEGLAKTHTLYAIPESTPAGD